MFCSRDQDQNPWAFLVLSLNSVIRLWSPNPMSVSKLVLLVEFKKKLRLLNLDRTSQKNFILCSVASRDIRLIWTPFGMVSDAGLCGSKLNHKIQTQDAILGAISIDSVYYYVLVLPSSSKKMYANYFVVETHWYSIKKFQVWIFRFIWWPSEPIFRAKITSDLRITFNHAASIIKRMEETRAGKHGSFSPLPGAGCCMSFVGVNPDRLALNRHWRQISFKLNQRKKYLELDTLTRRFYFVIKLLPVHGQIQLAESQRLLDIQRTHSRWHIQSTLNLTTQMKKLLRKLCSVFSIMLVTT